MADDFSRMATNLFMAVAQQIEEVVVTASLKGLANQMKNSGARLNKQQEAFIANVAHIPAGIRQQLNYDVGRAAQLSVQQAYTHRRHRKNTPPYRTSPNDPRNFRYAGGLLLRALQSKDFFTATPDRLLWGNINRLDAEAKQWRRLNFGAGAAGEESEGPQRFPMRWGTFVGEAIGIPDQVSPAFRIPKGWWLDGAFYPMGEAPPGRHGRPRAARMTAGIAASHFMDAGVRRIAEEYPKAASTMMERIYRNRPLAQKIEAKSNVAVPMPSGVQRFGRR